MRIVRYERTFEQNEELGLNDMKTENYGEEKENKAAAAKANEEEQAEETAALLDKSEKEQLLQVGGRKRKTMVPFKALRQSPFHRCPRCNAHSWLSWARRGRTSSRLRSTMRSAS